MKILIILPNWLGDAIMATPAIELLALHYPNAKFTFVGSFVSTEALKYHPQCEKVIIDETKKASSRLMATYRFAKELGAFDLAITFRNNLYSSLLLRFTGTVLTLARSAWHARFLLSHTPKVNKLQHLVEQYTQLAMVNSDDFDGSIPPLKLYVPKGTQSLPTLGINAGATYGSAKRWYPKRFAQVIAAFAQNYQVVLFGGPNEIEITQEIEQHLLTLGVKNFTNLAGKTNIKELCSLIGSCDLFLTNDSGPMHIAAAYQVPTVAIFGPTNHTETCQWMNAKSVIVRHEMECAPCMKRECPLGHHECMLSITAQEVIYALKSLE